MQVHRTIEELPSFRNAILTIGTFDGVHLGHKSIIAQMKTLAEQVDGETVILTFHPHPRRIVGQAAQPVQLLNSLPEKIELLEKAGIDHLVVVPFTQEFAAQPPEDYVENFLIRYFHPHTVIIGYDHRFGKNRAGDFHLLERYAAQNAFGLVEIPGKLLEESTISSTRIRQSLLQGDTSLAKKLLGYNYFFEGTVVKGNQLGRTLGYPTANLQLTDNEKLIPGNGVYAVLVRIKKNDTNVVTQPNTGSEDGTIGSNGDGYLRKGDDSDKTEDTCLKGMMNIGVRPTVDGLSRVIEVNIFDFSEDIYGATLQVTLIDWLRAEQKFAGLEALKAQLAKDKIASEKALTRPA